VGVAFSLFDWYASDLATWNVVHGSIAAVGVFLIWIYVSVVILLYGIQHWQPPPQAPEAREVREVPYFFSIIE